MDFEHPPADPLAQFRLWLTDAEGLGLLNPHACTLATVAPDDLPPTRTVLLKGLDERGVTIFTNYESRKARALATHPLASLLFYWDKLARQIRVEGRISKASEAESDAYFAGRPRGSQIGAWASPQSEPIASRAELQAMVGKIKAKYEGGDVPRPPFWGGYRLSLDRIEFWQGKTDRLHDRMVYEPDGDGGWTTTRLGP
jgi:pyridoxamine 5'-phosphate oxidase